jgi:hypothetical protein
MAKRPVLPIKSGTAWAKASLAQQKAHERMLEVVQAKRQHPTRSLSSLAKEFGTTLRTVKQHAGGVVSRDAKGRYAVRAGDRLYRRMQFYDAKGKIEGGVGVVGSRKATEIARYQNDVKRALKSRDFRALQKQYRGKAVRDKKVSYPYITDPAMLDRLDAAGEISFENLYARVG